MSFQPTYRSTPKASFRHRGLGILTPGMDSLDVANVLGQERRVQSSSSSNSVSRLGNASPEEVASELAATSSTSEGVGLGLNMTLIVGSITNGLAEASDNSDADSDILGSSFGGTPPSQYSSPAWSDDLPVSFPSPYLASFAFSVPARTPRLGTKPPNFGTPLGLPTAASLNANMSALGVDARRFGDFIVLRSTQSSTVAVFSSNPLMSAAINQAVSRMTFAEQDNFIWQLEERTSCGDLSSMSAGGGSLAGAPVTLGLGSPVPTEPSAASIVSSSPVADEVSEGDSAARSESPIEDAFDFGAQDGPLRLRPEFESGVGVGLPSALGLVAGPERSNTAAVNFVPVFVMGDDEDNDDEVAQARHVVGGSQEPEYYFYGPCPSLPGAGTIFAMTSGLPLRPLTPTPSDSMSLSVSACLVSHSEPLPSSSGPILEGPRDTDAEQQRQTRIPRPAPVKFWSFGHLFRGVSAKKRGMVKHSGNSNEDDDKTPTQASISRLAKLWSGVCVGFKSLKANPRLFTKASKSTKSGPALNEMFTNVLPLHCFLSLASRLGRYTSK